MKNKTKWRRDSRQKKRRPVRDRLFLHYPSGIPARIYPVQIRFRQCGQLPTSAIQSVFLSLIWQSSQSHGSLCSIPKQLSVSMGKILANITSITSFIIKKCELVGCKFYDINVKSKALVIKLINTHETAENSIFIAVNVTLITQIINDEP